MLAVRVPFDGLKFDKNIYASEHVHQVYWVHYSDIIMSMMASQITDVSTVCSTICSGANQRKYQSSASLALVRGIHRWPLDSPHKKGHASDHLCLIWKKSIQNCRRYRADTACKMNRRMECNQYNPQQLRCAGAKITTLLCLGYNEAPCHLSSNKINVH